MRKLIEVPDITSTDATEARRLALEIGTTDDLAEAIRLKIHHKRLTGWSYQKARLYQGDFIYQVNEEMTLQIMDRSGGDDA